MHAIVRQCHVKLIFNYNLLGTECPDGQVTCPFNQSECIPSQFLCDGTVNCYDESDESPLFCRKPNNYTCVVEL